MTLDTLLYTISAASSNTLDIGVYSESLIGTLVNYPSFPALIVNFTVTIADCITPNIGLTPTTYDYLIGATTVSW